MMDPKEQANQTEPNLEQNLSLPDDDMQNQPDYEGGGEQKPGAGGEQQPQGDGQEQPPGEEPPVSQGDEEKPLEERYQALETNYKRLERKFTRVSQELAEAREAADVLRWIQERPDLAEQIQALMDSYQGGPVEQHPPVVDFAELQRQTAEAWRFLLGRQDFVKNEQDIRDFAEDEGFDPDDPLQLKEAYRLWRGENADRLAQEQALKMQQRGAQKQEARKKAGLQGAGGPGGGPPPDYKKMSAEEVLAYEGLSLYTDD